MAQPVTTEYLDKKLDEQFERVNDLIKNSVDSIHVRFTLIDAELANIKRELKDISKRDIEDSNALAKSIMKLQKRVDILETQIKKLKIKQSSKV